MSASDSDAPASRRRPSAVPPVRWDPVEEPDARPRDGDVLLWRGTYTISRAFELVSRSWYSHVAFIIHWDGHPMVLQADAFGVQAVPFKETVRRYHGLVDWYRLTDQGRHRLKLPQTIEEATCNLGLPFGLPNALRELVYRGTGISLFRMNPKARTGMFCAEYVSRCFRSGGLDLLPGKDDVHTFPDDIAGCRSLLRFHCTISDTRRKRTSAPATMPQPQLAPATGVVPRLPIEAPGTAPAANPPPPRATAS